MLIYFKFGVFCSHLIYDFFLQALSLSAKITDEDIINVMGEKATACEKPQILPANSTAFVSKDALHYMAKQKRKNSFLISWKESNAKVFSFLKIKIICF